MTTSAAERAAIAVAPIEEIDAALASRVEPFRETVAVQALTIASKIGDQPPMRALSGATIAIGFLFDQPRLTKAGLRMIAAHTVATVLKDFLKRRLDRTRPDARSAGDDHRIRPGNDDTHEETSFPSGHSAGVVAAGAAFAREFPEHRVAALCTAGALAIANVPRGSHYLSDVIFGSAIGAASEAALDRIWRRISVYRASLSSEHRQAAQVRQLRIVEGKGAFS